MAIFALALILAPFIWRLGRNLASERAERIRSQERAEVAAHLHDSVLQTLTLMQKRADDPREVAALARRQERELRSWLAGERSERAGGFAARSRRRRRRSRTPIGCKIDVVQVGDCELDEAPEAVVAAAREALTNAAKFAAEDGPISALRRGRARAGSRPSSAIAAPGSIPRRCPPTAAACASRSSGGCAGTAAMRRSAPCPDPEPR